jgi:hypothetical protein
MRKASKIYRSTYSIKKKMREGECMPPYIYQPMGYSHYPGHPYYSHPMGYYHGHHPYYHHHYHPYYPGYHHGYYHPMGHDGYYGHM